MLSALLNFLLILLRKVFKLLLLGLLHLHILLDLLPLDICILHVFPQSSVLLLKVVKVLFRLFQLPLQLVKLIPLLFDRLLLLLLPPNDLLLLLIQIGHRGVDLLLLRGGLDDVLLAVQDVPLPLLVHHLHLVILQPDEAQRLLHRALQLILLLLHQLHPVQLLSAQLTQLFHPLVQLLNGSLEPARPNNILQELQHPSIILCQTFWFHQSYLLHLTLQDEEPIVVQVDALVHQQLGDIFRLASLVSNLVEGGRVLVLVNGPRHRKLTARNHVEILPSVNDLLEVYSHLGELDVGEGAAAVDHGGKFGSSSLLCSEPKDKEHGVDHIGLSASIWTHNACEALVEGTQNLDSSIGLKVLILNVGDDQSRPCGIKGAGRCRRGRNVDVPNSHSSFSYIPLLLHFHRISCHPQL